MMLLFLMGPKLGGLVQTVSARVWVGGRHHQGLQMQDCREQFDEPLPQK